MAMGTHFKQQCPSCETMVLVKDISMVGKKIECPKCKDRFIVKSPTKKKSSADEDDDDTPRKSTGKTVPAKKPSRRPDDDDVDDIEDLDEDELRTSVAKGKKKKSRLSDDEEAAPTRKKPAGRSMGIALAVVGLLVLGTAAFFILRSKGGGRPPIANVNNPGVPPATDPEEKVAPDKKETVEEPAVKPRPPQVALAAATAELTNLLPNDTDHVAHLSVRALLDPAGPWRDALFQTPGGLKDDLLRAKLGFSLLAIDDLIRADHYGTAPWSFTVVHFQEILDQAAVQKALALKPAPPIKNHIHYQVSAPNPWLQPLTRMALGLPRTSLSDPNKSKRALHVHFHDKQTLIFADEAPMIALLKEDKRFKALTDSPAPPAGAERPQVSADAKATTLAPATNAPTESKDDGGKSNPAVPLRLETYMTVKPALKAIMDRMESPTPDTAEKVLFSSATDLDAAQIPDSIAKGKNLWSPRQIWDVALLLQDRNTRLRALGAAVVQKDSRFYRLRNELSCPDFTQAESLQKELLEEIGPDLARFIDLLLGHKVDVSGKEEPMPTEAGNPAVAVPKDVKDDVSRIVVAHKEKAVEFILELKLDQSEMGKLQNIAALLSCGLGAAMDMTAGTVDRHELARAGKLLPEKGLTDRGVAPGTYPPGAFTRPLASNRPVVREPMQRMSWMAGLLPYLGQESLYGKINFNDSWRDPSNWFPAHTLVPQFLDPTYPTGARYVRMGDLPLELAATHFVGIAGVGLDAADYDPADPANAAKSGLLSYEKGITLKEVQQGHGLANTILMIQVPPDGIPGLTPWIAGGGSTLRGVPDKGSVAPFVFATSGNDGKPRRGTYALMADGSVRFIDESISDEVFKALATARGTLPAGLNLDAPDSKAQLIQAPKGFGAKNAPAPK